MTTATVHTAATVVAPRGAGWAAALYLAVARAWQRRQQARLARAEAAAVARDTRHVRALADEMALQDPRFAADLYAAADRQERRG